MQKIEVGDIITFRISNSWLQQIRQASMATTTSIGTYPINQIYNAVVLAAPYEFDGVVVMMWDGQKLIEYVVNKSDVIKVISPYNKFIEEL